MTHEVQRDVLHARRAADVPGVWVLLLSCHHVARTLALPPGDAPRIFACSVCADPREEQMSEEKRLRDAVDGWRRMYELASAERDAAESHARIFREDVEINAARAEKAEAEVERLTWERDAVMRYLPIDPAPDVAGIMQMIRACSEQMVLAGDGQPEACVCAHIISEWVRKAVARAESAEAEVERLQGLLRRLGHHPKESCCDACCGEDADRD